MDYQNRQNFWDTFLGYSHQKENGEKIAYEYPSYTGGCDYTEPYSYNPSPYSQSTQWYEPLNSNLEKMVDRFVHETYERMNNNLSFPINPPFEPYFPKKIPCTEEPSSLEKMLQKFTSETEERMKAQEERLNQEAYDRQNLENQVNQLLIMLAEESGNTQHSPEHSMTMQSRSFVPEFKPPIPYPCRLRDKRLLITSELSFEKWSPPDEEVCPQIQYNYPECDEFFSDLQDEPDYMEELIKEEPHNTPFEEQVSYQATPEQPKPIWGPELLEREDVENCADEILEYLEHLLYNHKIPEQKDIPVNHHAPEPKNEPAFYLEPAIDEISSSWEYVLSNPMFDNETSCSGTYHYFHPHFMSSDGFSHSIIGY